MDCIRRKVRSYSFRKDLCEELPDRYLVEGLDESAILNITISNDGREVFATLGGSDGVRIMHRYFDTSSERWSSWRRPSFADSGSINGYANLLSDGEHVLVHFQQGPRRQVSIYIRRIAPVKNSWSDVRAGSKG